MNRARVRGAIAARRHSSLLGALTAWEKHMEKRVGGMRGRRSKYIERGAKFSSDGSGGDGSGGDGAGE